MYLFKQLFIMNNPCSECLEDIGHIICTSQCGHSFCVDCIVNLVHGTCICPKCPDRLYDDTLNIASEDDSDGLTNVGCVDDIVDRFHDNEINITDVVSYYENRYNSKRDWRYRPSRSDMEIYHIERIDQLILNIIHDVDREHNESLLFEQEDVRLAN